MSRYKPVVTPPIQELGQMLNQLKFYVQSGVKIDGKRPDILIQWVDHAIKLHASIKPGVI